MSIYLYGAYEYSNSAELVVRTTEINNLPKPSAGFTSIELAKSRIDGPSTVVVLELQDDAEPDPEFNSTEEFKSYKKGYFVSMSIVAETN